MPSNLATRGSVPRNPTPGAARKARATAYRPQHAALTALVAVHRYICFACICAMYIHSRCLRSLLRDCRLPCCRYTPPSSRLAGWAIPFHAPPKHLFRSPNHKIDGSRCFAGQPVAVQRLDSILEPRLAFHLEHVFWPRAETDELGGQHIPVAHGCLFLNMAAPQHHSHTKFTLSHTPSVVLARRTRRYADSKDITTQFQQAFQ